MKDECREIRTRFDRFLDGDLAPEESSRVRDHVAGCEGCRVELRREQDVASMLESLPELRCPERVLQGIRATVREGKRSPVPIDAGRSRVRAFPWRWVPVGLAAAIAAYLLVGIPPAEDGESPRFTHSAESIRQARNTAKWSLAYAAVVMGSTQKNAIEGVLEERLPETLIKGLQSATQPETGGVS